MIIYSPNSSKEKIYIYLTITYIYFIILSDDASEIKQRLQRLKQKFGGKTSQQQQQQQQHY